jgi:serine/threonine protein kinase/Tol biopolymer transport system component
MTPEMTADRWQQVDRLFHSTLECAPEKRANFLSKACGDDSELRSEVESLLRAHAQDGSFLDLPAYEVAADFLADAFGGLLAGQQIGPYKIISPLASGGMGEVYLAQDTRLGRKIALKLLPPDFAKDQHRVRRFAQEARAASALNHPNVCVIHEVGKTSDGRHFIAMELVEGITLRERISHGPLSLADALTVAEQIAAALTAAHAAGVIHRDIKPENIMLHRDGYVKVLDFGLAKLNDSRSGRGNVNEASTIAHVHTEPGTQMGTVRYMSPEHLRERPVDQRADIWSFGVVLHEMVTGVTPFEARTRNEVIALILKRQPAKLRFFDDVPPEFQQMVAKALSKHRAQRYQTISELAADLKSLRRKLTGETSAEPLSLPDQNVAAKQRITKTSLESATRHKRKPQTHAPNDAWKSALTYISHTAEHVLSGIREHPKATIFSGLTAVVALLFLVPSVPRLTNRLRNFLSPPSQQESAPFQTIKITPLTNSGQSVCAAISPDGKFVAHAEAKDGMQRLLVTNIANAGNSEVVPPADVTYLGVTFSPDNNYLYFTRSRAGDASTLYQVSLPGGVPRKIKDEVDSPITLSPTGDRFAFVRFKRSGSEFSLIIAAVDGTEERTIATRSGGNRFSTDGPAWSPDGKSIVCAAGSWDNGYHMSLVEFDVTDGHETIIGRQRWFSVLQVAWQEDKSGLIISARDRWMSPFQLWRISYPQGESVKVTNDTAEYETASLSRNGNTIVSVQAQRSAQLWVAPDGDVQRARSITASTSGYKYGLNWTSNGKIVYSSMAGSNLSLWAINADGSDQTQLTVNAGDNFTPATLPDGRFIVFASNRTGSLNIWRINAADGSDPKQLTFTDGNSYPSCSPDGQWVLYDNLSMGNATLWKVPIEGGEPVRLIDKSARMPVASPDSQFIACSYYGENEGRGIAIFPYQGGPMVRLVPIPLRDWQRVQWIDGGHALSYIEIANHVSNIWSYNLVASTSRQVTDFKTDQIFAYAWSPDQKQLACLRGTDMRETMIIDDQK